MAIVEIPQSDILNALDAMSWTFYPYLDDPFQIHDYPYIVELIDSYNSLASLLPDDLRDQYPLVCID